MQSLEPRLSWPSHIEARYRPASEQSQRTLHARNHQHICPSLMATTSGNSLFTAGHHITNYPHTMHSRTPSVCNYPCTSLSVRLSAQCGLACLTAWLMFLGSRSWRCLRPCMAGSTSTGASDTLLPVASSCEMPHELRTGHHVGHRAPGAAAAPIATSIPSALTWTVGGM